METFYKKNRKKAKTKDCGQWSEENEWYLLAYLPFFSRSCVKIQNIVREFVNRTPPWGASFIHILSSHCYPFEILFSRKFVHWKFCTFKVKSLSETSLFEASCIISMFNSFELVWLKNIEARISKNSWKLRIIAIHGRKKIKF